MAPSCLPGISSRGRQTANKHKDAHNALRGRYILVKVSFNPCPLLDVILAVAERIFQAEETVGMSWGYDQNLSRHGSQATEGERQCI